MNKLIHKVLLIATILFGAVFCAPFTFADENVGTSISISPVNKILDLKKNKAYNGTVSIINGSNASLDFEMYATPYSYEKDEETNSYKLGFDKETSYTQLSRWITFKDTSGKYVSNPKFTAGPGETVAVTYRVAVPDSIPAGGQYAVIFAHTITANNAGGIKTEASPGMVIYGRSVDGETIKESSISNMRINRSINSGDGFINKINASATVRNEGNIDFVAMGTLKIESIFGETCYETQPGYAHATIMPDSELPVSDTWEDTPMFGIFRVTWTVTATGEPETITGVVIVFPPFAIVLVLLLLTIITIWVIIKVRKRKEHQSKTAG